MDPNTDQHAAARATRYRVVEEFKISPSQRSPMVYAVDAIVTGAELGAFLPDVLDCLEPIAEP